MPVRHLQNPESRAETDRRAARLAFLGWLVGLPDGADTRRAAQAALARLEARGPVTGADEAFMSLLRLAARCRPLTPVRRRRARRVQ